MSRRWVTARRDSDCNGCLGPIAPGESILVDSERGSLCASCGCDLEVQSIEAS